MGPTEARGPARARKRGEDRKQDGGRKKGVSRQRGAWKKKDVDREESLRRQKVGPERLKAGPYGATRAAGRWSKGGWLRRKIGSTPRARLGLQRNDVITRKEDVTQSRSVGHSPDVLNRDLHDRNDHHDALRGRKAEMRL
ncbi:hypothetical protein KM043_008681 [Ampulex compressa]|nr:hypothetical protein KM043_008681 [Ampulex compressa]